MMKLLLTFCAALFLGGLLRAQNPIPDAGFESWASDAFNLYEEPASGWWASLNPIKSLGAPVTVEKDMDAHSGTYSAKLTTRLWGTLLLPGLLVSGEFNINNTPDFITQGQPFTDRPTAFSGWYKYAPVNGDSAAVAMLLTRWDATNGRRDTIAEAAFIEYNAVNTWSQFNLPFVYFSNASPDTMILALVSSADGSNFNGAVGSTLWVDDLDMDMTVGQAESSSIIWELAPLPADEQITLRSSERGTFRLINLAGEIVFEQATQGELVIRTVELPSGIYLGQFCTRAGACTTKNIVVWHE